MTDYRYRLWRTVNPYRTAKTLLFVMLNPSVADQFHDDPTIRRCTGFARSWGFDHFYVGNLFAMRATDPKVLRKTGDPVGELNDNSLLAMAAMAQQIVCAWGDKGWFQGRDEKVKHLLRDYDLFQIGPTRTKVGDRPRHPLYLSKALKPVLWRPKFVSRLDEYAEYLTLHGGP